MFNTRRGLNRHLLRIVYASKLHSNNYVQASKVVRRHGVCYIMLLKIYSLLLYVTFKSINSATDCIQTSQGCAQMLCLYIMWPL
jgi:hypothetical protein